MDDTLLALLVAPFFKPCDWRPGDGSSHDEEVVVVVEEDVVDEQLDDRDELQLLEEPRSGVVFLRESARFVDGDSDARLSDDLDRFRGGSCKTFERPLIDPLADVDDFFDKSDDELDRCDLSADFSERLRTTDLDLLLSDSDAEDRELDLFEFRSVELSLAATAFAARFDARFALR